MTVRSYRIRKRVLDALAAGKSITAAAKHGGVSVSMLRNWRKDDANFAADWEDAIEAGTDYLEDLALRSARKGSDGMTQFLLKARRPEKYRERSQVEHSGGIDLTGAKEKLQARFDALDAARGAKDVDS